MSTDHLIILLVGSGGREHAIAWKLAQSPRVAKIFVAPGNGGTATESEKILNATIEVNDFEKLKKFALENEVNLVVPGPEQPLVAGIQDSFKKIGIPVFGPSLAAARMEGSKAFSKDFMKRHRIPTAAYENFSTYEDARAYLEQASHRVVLKASGLAAGKGVLIPITREDSLRDIKTIMLDRAFGDAGKECVIEEYLEGEELSIFSFSDGYTIATLPPAQDHKRIFDNDQGPNTGGMGAYAPTPVATPALLEEIHRTILQPTIDGMRRDGFPFVGLLFTGIMLTASGPKVLEYNVRFGDPETEVVLPLLDSDLAEIMLACAEGRLDAINISIKTGFAATVVIASGGYPDSYSKGHRITFTKTHEASEVHIFHAGTSQNTEGKLVTSGGRVLVVSAMAPTLQDAVTKAYAGVGTVHFDNMYYRRDIAHRGIKHLSKQLNNTMTYASAGVSVDAGNLLVQNIKQLVRSTRRTGADAEIGGFGGLFDLKAAGFRDPILVSATDGIGTKIKIAQAIGIHDTVGIDLVAMNVNDVIVQGAEPLFFLDYFACSRLEVNVARDFVAGVVNGCLQAGAALVGGETAEMPGIYALGEYDAAGFTVGAVDREKLLPREGDIKAGDVLLGLASSGLHSNGFSLVRKIIANQPNLNFRSICPWNTETTLGKALLIPTRIYVKQLLPVVRADLVKAMSHITGGGFDENIPRVIPSHLGVTMNATSWELPAVFKWLMKAGNISSSEMSRTFNCGIGMILVVAGEKVNEVTQLLQEAGEKVYRVGAVVTKENNGNKSFVMHNADTTWI